MSHPFRPFAFIAGLLLTAVGAAWLFREHDVVSGDQLAVAAPVLLIAIGVAGIALTLRRKS